jgi:YD repeat-containing protein
VAIGPEVRSVQLPLGQRTTVVYDVGDTGVIDARGNRTTYTYTGDGQLYSVTDPLVGERFYVWEDTSGKRESSLDAEGRATLPNYPSVTLVYDTEVVESIQTPSGNRLTYTYDSAADAAQPSARPG